MMLFHMISTFAFVSTVLSSDCTHIRIEGSVRGSTGLLECQLTDGTWGTVCKSGFHWEAANAVCKQLGYDKSSNYETARNSGDYLSHLPIAVCYTDCSADLDKFSQCNLQHFCAEPCSYFDYVTISCANNGDDNPTDGSFDDKSTPRHRSTGTVAGTTIGGLSVFGVILLLVICRIYVRYSYIRRRNNNNQTYVVTQQRHPRMLIARMSRTTTVPSGPPPPPPYTPTQPTNDYTPVPPRSYQPVATDDYTTTPTAPSSDIPSEPPPEYTPRVSTDDVPLVTQDTEQ
ncbi:uncharacterized protein [Dysidea avara]|uniref:uncharacterized protein n=1 Tax=Dysidea avara TaxID=196820 RepID=UPI0033293004